MNETLLNINILWGTDAAIAVDVIDLSGERLNINECTSKLQVRSSFESPAVITLDSTKGVHIDAEAGRITYIFSAEETKISPGNYRYDSKIIFAEGSVMPGISGILSIKGSVTDL